MNYYYLCYRRINRNIVECKVCSSVNPLCCFISRINRNIVECKGENSQGYYTGPCGINRNIVECKARTSMDRKRGKGVLIETLWNVKMG